MQPNFLYRYFPNQTRINLILHGGKHGIDSSFMQAVFTKSIHQKQSSLMFNFPYMDAGAEKASDNLATEVVVVAQMRDWAKTQGFTEFNLIGKSLGGIVASYSLNQGLFDLNTTKALILGYVTADIDLTALPQKLVVVQGELDKHGNALTVSESLSQFSTANWQVHEIAGASHSFENELKEPKYVEEALDIGFANL